MTLVWQRCQARRDLVGFIYSKLILRSEKWDWSQPPRVLEVEECHSIQMGSERKIRLYVPYKWGIHRDDLTNWKISNGLNHCGRDFGSPTRRAPTAFLCVLTREVGSGQLLCEELGSCGGNFGGKGKPQRKKWWETIPHVKKWWE